MTLTCQQCNKRLSRKTARLIEGRVLCSACMFTPQRMKGAAIAAATGTAKTPQVAEGEASQSGAEGNRPDTPPPTPLKGEAGVCR